MIRRNQVATQVEEVRDGGVDADESLRLKHEFESPHLVALLWSCGQPLIPFSLDTPPVVLTPISFANITDGRGRFREIYCAIRDDHGAGLPEDLPCDDALVRLAGEPPGTGRPVNLASIPHPLHVIVVPGIFEECVRKYVRTYSPMRSRTWNVMAGAPGPSRPADDPERHTTRCRSAISCWACLWLLGDRVLLVGYSKGAADTLEALNRYPEMLPRVAAMVSVAGALWQHDPSEPIGRILSIAEDKNGLQFKAAISDTSRGRDALALLKDGAIGEMSIGYDTVKGGMDYTKSAQGETVRNLRALKLWEISLVTFPANESAVVTGVK